MVDTTIHKHLIDEDERSSAAAVARLLATIRSGERVAKLVIETATGTAQTVDISMNLAMAFLEISKLIEAGSKEISLFADDPELSPEVASNLLGMSQPMVARRIRLGDLAARKVGSDHRIKTSELLAFRAREAERKAALAEFGETTDALAMKHGL
jgi:hypothetical protein